MGEDKKAAKRDKKNDIQREQIQTTEFGAIQVDEEVIASIAAFTVAGMDGVAAMVGGMTDGLSEMLGKKPQSKGVKVEFQEDGLHITVHIHIYYGVELSTLGHAIQEAVFERVLEMTDLRTKAVDIHVLGVQFPTEAPSDTPDTNQE